MSSAGKRFCLTPKFRFWLGPISLSCAILSRFTSVQVRTAVSESIGLFIDGDPVALFWTYVLTLTLIAVRPLPNRSYDAPKRGERLFQFGMSGTASKDRAGTKRPAAADCGSTDALRWSKRRPPLTVMRLSVQTSWT